MKVRHMNALLMEILLAVFFFALSATVILELFTAGNGLSARADALDRAVSHARQISQQLYAAEDMQTALEANGFAQSAGVWHLSAQDYVLEATLEEEVLSAGTLRRACVSALVEGEDARALRCARYVAGEAEA